MNFIIIDYFYPIEFFFLEKKGEIFFLNKRRLLTGWEEMEIIRIHVTTRFLIFSVDKDRSRCIWIKSKTRKVKREINDPRRRPPLNGSSFEWKVSMNRRSGTGSRWTVMQFAWITVAVAVSSPRYVAAHVRIGGNTLLFPLFFCIERDREN